MLILSSSISPVCYASPLPSLDDITQKAQMLTERISFEYIIDYATTGLLSYAKQFSGSFGICMAVIITCIVFSSMKSSFHSNENLFEIISVCLITICIFSPISLCFEKVEEHLEALCAFMLSFIPAGAVMHAASGNPLSSSLLATSGPASIALMQTISVSFLMPMIKAVFALQTVNVFYKKVNLTSLTNLLKSITLWVLGLSFTIFSGVMSLQTILKGSADNLALKGMKYGAARLIPIAGSIVSESMQSVISSVGYIKSVTGVSGIVFIVYTILPPILAIIITKFFLAILSALAGVTAQSSISSHLSGLSSVLNILAALLIGCSIAFIILMAMFMKTNIAI